MRIVKLPHLPSDTTQRIPGDLMADFWYKAKEIIVNQTKRNKE